MFDELKRLDGALVRLRRLWSTPRQMVIDDNGQHIEMSSVLVVEACAVGADRGVNVGVDDVAEFADVTPSTASRLVNRAVQAGLIHRGVPQHDRRRSALQLTPAGQALRDRAFTTRIAWLSAVGNDWSRDDLHALADLLGRFADAVTEPPMTPTPPTSGRSIENLLDTTIDN